VEWIKNNAAAGGAFKLESWKPGQQSVYVRFDDWKSGPLPKLEKVIVPEVPSAGNRRALLERSDADISFDLPPKDFAEIAALLEAKGVVISSCPGLRLHDYPVSIQPAHRARVSGLSP